jgi:hypothetical protein
VRAEGTGVSENGGDEPPSGTGWQLGPGVMAGSYGYKSGSRMSKKCQANKGVCGQPCMGGRGGEGETVARGEPRK